jgi:hypothetical protein
VLTGYNFQVWCWKDQHSYLLLYIISQIKINTRIAEVKTEGSVPLALDTIIPD